MVHGPNFMVQSILIKDATYLRGSCGAVSHALDCFVREASTRKHRHGLGLAFLMSAIGAQGRGAKATQQGL